MVKETLMLPETVLKGFKAGSDNGVPLERKAHGKLSQGA
jgi:hypothetical protein